MTFKLNQESLIAQLDSCRKASRELRALSTDKKNKVILRLAELIKKNETAILNANQEDQKSLTVDRREAAFLDRLMLDSGRIDYLVESLKQVAQLTDPVGEVVETKTLPNGLQLRRQRAPLGVLFMIFESRPNVITEAFSLAFKSGNVIILRGGKETMKTAAVLYRIIGEALIAENVDANCLLGITEPDRAITHFLLEQNQKIDVVVPRGGEGLIRFVVENSKIPIIKNDRGMCHAYIHQDADLKMASEIIKNGKVQRPGVCNSLETVLVHEKVAGQLLPMLYQTLKAFHVEWFGCPETVKILEGLESVSLAKPENWDTEYLDFKMNCRVVPDALAAFGHIDLHSSKHSEVIVTADEQLATKFQNEIDAAAVYWNASTRFTDGFEFGLGGELGISTQKIHVRGPVGLRELTSLRWIGTGTGQVRV